MILMNVSRSGGAYRFYWDKHLTEVFGRQREPAKLKEFTLHCADEMVPRKDKDVKQDERKRNSKSEYNNEIIVTIVKDETKVLEDAKSITKSFSGMAENFSEMYQESTGKYIACPDEVWDVTGKVPLVQYLKPRAIWEVLDWKFNLVKENIGFEAFEEDDINTLFGKRKEEATTTFEAYLKEQKKESKKGY